MALPATKNLSYYRGDTFTFAVYPKTTNGAAMSLIDANDNAFESYFFISTNRTIEDPTDVIECITSTNTSESYILCQISSIVGRDLVPGTAYVYEVKIKNTYNGEIYTLVTGNLTVTGSVEVV